MFTSVRRCNTECQSKYTTALRSLAMEMCHGAHLYRCTTSSFRGGAHNAVAVGLVIKAKLAGSKRQHMRHTGAHTHTQSSHGSNDMRRVTHCSIWRRISSRLEVLWTLRPTAEILRLGPQSHPRQAANVDEKHVVACALRLKYLGARFPEPLAGFGDAVRRLDD